MATLITSFYVFSPMSKSQVDERVQALRQLGAECDLRGLILIGTEGFNLTVSGSAAGIAALKNLFTNTWQYKHIIFKDSEATKHPFRLFKVQMREEVVTLGRSEIQVPDGPNHHLTPSQWNEKMNNEDVVVIDTRNWYEVEIGKFKNAVDFGLNEFREFPEALKARELPKDKNYLIYCTGGIRCEKAIEEMRRQGFDKVNQLEGGILKYIEEFPEQNYEGECFVFDHRVAVDQQLKPSRTYRLCPHCGQPGTLKLLCLRCDHDATICSNCAKFEYNKTCSKNCAHHYRVRPGVKGPHQYDNDVIAQST